MNVFQSTILSFFEGVISFSADEQLEFLTALADLDFATINVYNFDILFSGLTFPSSLSSKIRQTISEDEGFKSLTSVINVLTVIRDEDPSFDPATFDQAEFMQLVVEKDVFSSQNVEMSTLVELTEAISTDVTVVSNIATKVTTELALVDPQASVRKKGKFIYHNFIERTKICSLTTKRVKCTNTYPLGQKMCPRRRKPRR